jgi:hypothetical protein
MWTDSFGMNMIILYNGSFNIVHGDSFNFLYNCVLWSNTCFCDYNCRVKFDSCFFCFSFMFGNDFILQNKDEKENFIFIQIFIIRIKVTIIETGTITKRF